MAAAGDAPAPAARGVSADVALAVVADALRLLAAALIIFAAAGPIWNPHTGASGGKAPLLIMLDDGSSSIAFRFSFIVA